MRHFLFQFDMGLPPCHQPPCHNFNPITPPPCSGYQVPSDTYSPPLTGGSRSSRRTSPPITPSNSDVMSSLLQDPRWSPTGQQFSSMQSKITPDRRPIVEGGEIFTHFTPFSFSIFSSDAMYFTDIRGGAGGLATVTNPKLCSQGRITLFECAMRLFPSLYLMFHILKSGR